MSLRSLQDCAFWLVGEYSEMLNRLPFVRPTPCIAEVHIGAGGGRLRLNHADIDQADDVESVTVEDLETELKKLRGRRPRLCSIIVAEGGFVTRYLSPLRLPHSRAVGMAAADVAINTPFSPPDVHAVLCSSQSGNDGTRYCLIKRSELDPILDRVSRSGWRLGELVFHASDNPHTAERRCLTALTPKRFMDRLGLWLAVSLPITAILGVIMTLAIADTRLRRADEAIDVNISAARRDVGEARKAFDAIERRNRQTTALQREKTLSGSVVYVWERLSRALPDDSWLSDLTIDDRNVVLTGLSASAARLIPILEKDGAFEGPEFRAAVMRVPGQEVERFTLEMRLREIVSDR